MATAEDVARLLLDKSHAIARQVDETPTGVEPGYSAVLGGTVLPNGKVRYVGLGALSRRLSSTSWLPVCGFQREAMETAHYTRGASSQSVSHATETRLNWATLVQDAGGTVTTGASWKFTAPAAAIYAIAAYCSMRGGTGTYTAGLFYDLIVRNDSGGGYLGMIDYRDITPATYGSSGPFVYLHGELRLSLTAGQAIYITAENQGASGVSATALTDSRDAITIIRET